MIFVNLHLTNFFITSLFLWPFVFLFSSHDFFAQETNFLESLGKWKTRKWGNCITIQIGKLNSFFDKATKAEQFFVFFLFYWPWINVSVKLAIKNALEVKRKSNIFVTILNWKIDEPSVARLLSHVHFLTKDFLRYEEQSKPLPNFDDLGYPKWKDIPWRQMARFLENCKIGLYENNKVFSSLCTL